MITRDRRAMLAACLQSLVEQQYRAHEVIVVDNGSSDDTCQFVAREHPTARLLPQEGNLGVPGGRNRGAEVARGDVLVFLDDDARLLAPTALAQVAAAFAADERLACLSFLVRGAASGEEERRSIPRRDKQPRSTDYEAAYFCGTGFALRRSAFEQAGGFWAPLSYACEELDLSYRLLERGWRIVHSRGIEILHQQSPAARPDGQYVYFNARARCWVALRNLPWPQALSTTATWWAHTGWVGLRAGQMGAFARGVRDALRGAPAAWRERRPISRATLARVRQCSGRTWY